MNPLISVIVPVYNVEKYIDRCVKSISEQEYSELEIILVDDGSTDQSGILCDRWMILDKRIQVVHKENGGLSDARNVGIYLAKGIYLLFVDGDDYIEPQMIQKLWENMRDTEADISVCEFEKQIEGAEESICQENIQIKEYVKPEIVELLFKNDFCNKSTIIVAWNKLYKSELFRNTKYPIGKLHEDEYVIHQLLYNANKIVYTTEKLYHYMQRENSITATFSLKRIWDMLDAYTMRMDFFLERGEKGYCKKTFAEWIYKVKKCYSLCLTQKAKKRREIQRQIKKSARGTLLKMHKEYIIVGIRFWKELIWTIAP